MVENGPGDWNDNPEWDDANSRPLSDGERLIVARAKLGLTQQATADLLGISVATLRNWEQHRTEPDGPAKVLIRLLHAHPGQIRDWLSAA